jgi:hypothetical protein
LLNNNYAVESTCYHLTIPDKSKHVIDMEIVGKCCKWCPLLT